MSSAIFDVVFFIEFFLSVECCFVGSDGAEQAEGADRPSREEEQRAFTSNATLRKLNSELTVQMDELKKKNEELKSRNKELAADNSILIERNAGLSAKVDGV